MRYIWSVLCKRAILDEATRKLSLIDIPEILTLPQLPPAVPEGEKVGLGLNSTFVVDFWFGPKDDPVVEVRLFWRGPDGHRVELGDAGFDSSDKPRNTRARLLLDIVNVEYRGLGVYQLELEMKAGKRWVQVASYPVAIALSPAASISPEQPSVPTHAVPPESSSRL